MSEKGIVPITEKLLQKNFLFAAEFREGFIFGRVVRRRNCIYKPYYLIDSAGSAVTIAKSTAQAEIRFRDPRNAANEILYLYTSTNNGYPWIMHGAIGMSPQWINAYPRFPEGKDIQGKFPNIDPIRPSSGDDTGYIDSRLSPYDDPTDWLEIVIPPGQHLGCEYYNKDSARGYQPKLNLLFSVYWFQALTTDKYSNLIKSIALRQVPAAFLTVGFGDVPLELGDTLTKDWGVTPMSLDEAISGGT